MSWFPLNILALIFLRIWATPKDRRALSILLGAAIGSRLMVVFIMREVQPSWSLAMPGSTLVMPAAVELLTIAALMTFAECNLGTIFQVILLLIACWCHLQCFADIQLNTNVIYDHYEQILAGVAIGQLLGFYDTLFALGRSLQGFALFWANRLRGIPAASLSTRVLRDTGGHRIQKTQ